MRVRFIGRTGRVGCSEIKERLVTGQTYEVSAEIARRVLSTPYFERARAPRTVTEPKEEEKTDE